VGYYSDFDLSENTEEVITELEKVSEYSFLCDGGKGYSIKWYDCENHMKQVSKMFPDQLLSVEVEGEESGDIWKGYFKNGKMQRYNAIITFEDFDENKLK